MVKNEDTAGRCCWPDQAWSHAKSRCIGAPTCPAKFEVDAAGASCVAREMVAPPVKKLTRAEAAADAKFSSKTFAELISVNLSRTMDSYPYFGIPGSSCGRWPANFVEARLSAPFDDLPAGATLVFRLRDVDIEKLGATRDLQLTGLERAGRGPYGQYVYCGIPAAPASSQLRKAEKPTPSVVEIAPTMAVVSAAPQPAIGPPTVPTPRAASIIPAGGDPLSDLGPELPVFVKPSRRVAGTGANQ